MFTDQRFHQRRVETPKNMEDRKDSMHASRGNRYRSILVIRGGGRPIRLAQSDADDFPRGFPRLFFGQYSPCRLEYREESGTKTVLRRGSPRRNCATEYRPPPFVVAEPLHQTGCNRERKAGRLVVAEHIVVRRVSAFVIEHDPAKPLRQESPRAMSRGRHLGQKIWRHCRSQQLGLLEKKFASAAGNAAGFHRVPAGT